MKPSDIKVLVAFERSGIVRSEFRKLGFDAWSCDIVDADDGSEHHFKCDVRSILEKGWHLMIAHPPCTRLANSGVRWLNAPPKNKTIDQMWLELFKGAELYKTVRDANIPFKAIENPIMHKYAKELIEPGKRQVVQPWQFGDKAFKATGFELKNLPNLKPTNVLVPPLVGTEEHKNWSFIHRMPPGPDRERLRSQTFPGIARALADQYGNYVMKKLQNEV